MSQTVAPAPRTSWVRRHKFLTTVLVLTLALCLTLGGWFLYLNHQLSEVPRFEADLDRKGRPARVETGARNILVAGVDNGQGADLQGMLTSGDWEPGSFRSDAIMVLHIDEDRNGAQLVSFPRDSYVPIPGHGLNKINAAFSFGGPTLLAQTIEDYAEIHIDNIMVVDFNGFKDITETIGGVEVHVPETVHDSKQNKTWKKGTHVVEGEEALLYVRQRYGLPNGAFDRERRQMVFLRAVLAKLTASGTLTNPVKITRLAGQISSLVATDSDFTPDRMRRLSLSMWGFRTQDLGTAAVPYTGLDMIDGMSVVTLDRPAILRLFEAVEHDRFDRYVEAHPGVLTSKKVN